jgi:hypothetical protein
MIKTKSCDGHELIFNSAAKGRQPRYLLDGKKVAGVSSIKEATLPTSYNLINWKCKESAKYAIQAVEQHFLENNDLPSDEWIEQVVESSAGASKKESKKATDIGTIVHEYCLYRRMDDRQQLLKLTKTVGEHVDKDKILNCVKLFEMYLNEHTTDEVVKVEHSVGHPERGIAGTLDVIIKRPNVGMMLCDYKTSSGIYPDMFIQTALYDVCVERWDGLEMAGYEIVRLGKEEDKPDVVCKIGYEDRAIIRGQAFRCIDTFDFFRGFKCGK